MVSPPLSVRHASILRRVPSAFSLLSAAFEQNFSAGVYLSTDTKITSANTLPGHRHVAGLAVGVAATVTTTVSIPATLAPGTYDLGASADYTNVQREINETNNILAGAALAVVREVDLIMNYSAAWTR